MPSHQQLQPPLPPHTRPSQLRLPCSVERWNQEPDRNCRHQVQGLSASSLTVCEASLLLLLQLEEILLPEADPSLVIVIQRELSLPSRIIHP